MELTDRQIEHYMEEARQVAKHAYNPYSDFPVGCVLLMNDGNTFKGVNVENVSFGATNCAERTAIFTAATAGYRPHSIGAVFVAGETKDFLMPCNLCRQVLVEWAEGETPIYLTRDDGEITCISLEELTPKPFKRLDM